MEGDLGRNESHKVRMRCLPSTISLLFHRITSLSEASEPQFRRRDIIVAYLTEVTS